MKKFHLYIIAALLFSITSVAQKTDAYEMMVNGVKVIVQPGHNEIVQVKTIIKGGVVNYGAEKAGIESLAMTALTECGTLHDDKNSFKNKLDKVSGQVYGSTNNGYASLDMNCIKSDFETVWPLYADALTVPKFDAKEFTRIKEDALNGLRQQLSDPDASLDLMLQQTAFKGTDYEKNPRGSIETVTPLTATEVQQYYKNLLTRSRLLIVIVGDVEKENLQQKISALLQNIPQGKAFQYTMTKYEPASNSFTAQQKENATNYITGVTGGPATNAPDFNAYLLASRIFYDKNFLEVRTNNGLSYAPGSYFASGFMPYTAFYVTTTDPDKFVAVERNLIDKVKKQGFTEDELKNMKTTYTTYTYYRQQSNAAQANALASNEIYFNNWKRTYTLKEDLKKVTLSELNTAFKKYISNITWVYQGDPKKANPLLFTQKEIPPVPKDIKAF